MLLSRQPSHASRAATARGNWPSNSRPDSAAPDDCARKAQPRTSSAGGGLKSNLKLEASSLGAWKAGSLGLGMLSLAFTLSASTCKSGGYDERSNSCVCWLVDGRRKGAPAS